MIGEEVQGVLIRAHRQEAVARASIHAIAARCGLGCSFRDFDYGIEMAIPRTNVFSVATLGHLMDKVRKREEL